MELENFFDNDDNEIDDQYYKRYNNFRHQKIERSKPKTTKTKKNLEKKEKSDNKNELEEDEEKKKLKNERNKKKLNQLSKFEILFLTLFKKVSIIRENKMIYQIIVVYIILFVIFLLIIIYLKNFLVSTSYNTFENKNYYPFVESDIIRKQNNLKIFIDKKNTNNMISSLDEQLLFMEIYTQELYSHNILKNNIFHNLNNEELEKYEDELGDNFKTTININNLINEEVTNENIYNIKNLVPFYYHFIPVIFQNLGFFGLNMVNFYFIGNDQNCDINNDEDKINNLYFKYPLEDNNLGINFKALNNKIYDYIIDPFIEGNSGYTFEENLLDLIKENNWYYNIIKENKDIEIHFRFIKLMKINQENERKDYYMIYDKFNLNYEEDKTINFLFAIRLSKLDLKYPFVLLDEYNDTLNYDYLSIFNFDKAITQINISNLEKSIFENDYNIDDSNNIILKYPKFIENMNLFGMKKKEKSTTMRNIKEENNLFSDNSIMVKYKEIKDIQNNYNINYYFDDYILYYKILYFLNQFNLFKQKNPTYLTKAYRKKDISNDDNEHPCSISNIDEYYYTILDKFDYDCTYDYCFYHSCDSLSDLYLHTKNIHWPNCYCLPLFCKDEKTQKNSEFEKILKKKLNIEINEEFDYSYTSNFDYFFSELEMPFSFFMVYFNRFTMNFKCQIFFDKKNIEENNTYITNIIYQNYEQHSSFTQLFVFLYNKAMLIKIINELHKNSLRIVEKVVYGYLILFFGLGILLLCYIYISCNKLINRMNKIKNIRKEIISNANNLNNNINKSNNNDGNTNKFKEKNINENIDNNSINNLLEKDKINKINNNEINNNENDNLINVHDIKYNERKNEKSININDKDELDELMELINDNLPTFKIEFNLNEEINDNLNNIKKQYNEIIQVNKYKNKLLLKEDKEEIIFDNNEDSSITSSNNTINIKKNENVDDLSVNIFSELLSLSNHKFDFSNIKTNFYYKENNDNSLYNLNQYIGVLNEANNNSNENVEITNIDKLQNALEHYFNNIHSYWKNYYDIQKAKDEI